MALSTAQRDLIGVIQDGLPLVPRPYRALGKQAGSDEAGVIENLRSMCESGVIKRFGIVVRHRELGYKANAMVVWDVPDAQVDAVGSWLGERDAVTLCYQRPRVPPHWPYNLFCMIHGRDRDTVRSTIDALRESRLLRGIPYATLFSVRRFKQRGARYVFEGQSQPRQGPASR